MSHGHDGAAHAPHAHPDAPHGPDAGHGHGHGDVRNPDYDGPDRHCLPAPVKPSLASGIVFALLMLALAAGAAWLGVHLL